ncbi:MAG: family 10 glycosylhydrolase, partial [Rikenellaceae bacterium]|nr:family 10 glycosylhydrolase [Rikenellaceae bacterium]
TRAGQTNYDDLYADILTWCREGWIDHVVPQIYWHIGHPLADYKTIAEWWNAHNYGTPLYIGHASYLIDPKSTNKAWQTPWEIVRQVALNRTLLNIQGSMLYSANSLSNDSFKAALSERYYAQKALWPENPRIDPIEPVAPARAEAVREGDRWIFRWHPETNARRFVLYRFSNRQGDDPFEDPQYIVRITTEDELAFPVTEIDFEKYRYAVTALSPAHQESLPTYIFPK